MSFLRSLYGGVRRLLRGGVLALVAIILFIEEWGWRPLTAGMAWMAKWPPFARLEALIRRVPPWAALVLFLVPAVMLFPIKLVALWLIHRGQAALGVAVIVATKLLGTALVGRLFVLTEPQLMQFAWFARALRWWRDTKERVKSAVKRSAAWRAARRTRRRLRVLFRRFAR